MSDCIISLLRHGEVEGGARFRGGQDDALSAAGWAQLWAASVLAPGIAAVVSSPARRCADFAQALAVELGGLPLDLSPAFAERHFGDWEGLAAHEIPSADLTCFWNDPVGYTPPGAEPLADFRRRVLDGWQALREGCAGDTLVLTHGGVVRVILAQVLGMTDWSGLLVEVPPACLSRVRLPAPPGRASLISHGVGAH
jgi:broad specificity phosphatase PhoE